MNKKGSVRIFLSASVPLPTRDLRYFETADVLAIRDAVRALATVIAEREGTLVFGGHPAITPIIRLQMAGKNQRVSSCFELYQSRFFRKELPPDNDAFERVILTEQVVGNKNASLHIMRKEMLQGFFNGAVFIGGMEGVKEEHDLFKARHPKALIFPVASTGAAAAILFDAMKYKHLNIDLANDVSYLGLMRSIVELSATTNEVI